MARAKSTESHKISSSLMKEIRKVADKNDRTYRAQMERFIRAGMEYLDE